MDIRDLMCEALIGMSRENFERKARLKPQIDRRHTSQRITDEMNQMKSEIKWYRKWLEQIDLDGPVTGEDAEKMRRWARLALTQAPNHANSADT